LQIEYCEEKLRCRRVLLMGHFGESFDPGLCRSTCDICSRADGRTFQGAVPSRIMQTRQHNCIEPRSSPVSW
jgi:superfamily II DNA helicase RecQ